MELEEFEPNPCYEEVGETDRARHQTTKVDEEEGTTERGNKKWIGVLLVALSIQALLLTAVVVAAGFFSKEIITMYDKIEQLREQVQHMKEQIHLAKFNETDILLQINSTFKRTTILDQLVCLHSSVNTLNTTTMEQLNNLQSSVNTLNTTTLDQQSNLQYFVNNLTIAQNSTDIQVSSLQSSLNTLTSQQVSTTSQVTSLQSLMNNLTSRINSSRPVDLYEGCVDQTRTCTLSQSLNDYWRTCRTIPLYSDPSVGAVVTYI